MDGRGTSPPEDTGGWEDYRKMIEFLAEPGLKHKEWRTRRECMRFLKGAANFRSNLLADPDSPDYNEYAKRAFFDPKNFQIDKMKVFVSRNID
jgi:hypothetical protein